MQVRIDRPDATPLDGITVDECVAVSRALEAWLDGSETLGARYVLEVSSPGIERPLRWREHWERFVGHPVRVRPTEGDRFQAVIERVDPDADVVVLRSSDGDARSIALADIREATLVIDWAEVERQANRRARANEAAKEHG